MTNVDEQIVKYLQFKPSAKVLELSSALNIEKRTIENTLSRLQANRKIRKASGKPDEWSLSNISKCKMYGPSGGGQSRGRGSGRPKGSSRYHNQQNQHNFRGERPLNKTYPELTQKIIELFQRKNCMLTSEILADLRLEKSLINRTLYGLEKKGILRKIAESPPKWCFTGTSNYSEKLVKNSLSKHFTIPHYLMNCRDHYTDYQSGSNSNLNSAIEPYRYVPIDISCGSYNPGQLPQPSYGGRYQSHGHFDGYSETALHSTNSTGPFAVCDTVGVMPQSGPFGILGFNSSYPKHDLPCINSPNTYFSCESNVVSSEAVNYGLKNSGFSMPIINNADADFSFTTCLPAGEQPKNVDDQLLEKILLTLKGTKNCTVSVKELSEILHCSPNHIEYHLEILENKECVSRVAPDIWVLVGDNENFDGNNIGENSPASFVEVPTSGSSANGAYSSANFQPPLSPHELIASNPIYKYDSLTEKQNISYQSNAGYASEKDFTTTCPKAPFHFGDANINIKSPEFSFNSTAVSVQGSSVASLEQKFKKTEISPQSEIDLQITPESFAVLNKNPISALMEYAQQRHLAVEFKLLSQRGPSHRPLFKIAVAIGKKVFPSVESGNKKDAKTDAAALALRILIAEGQYQMESGFLAPKITMQFSEMTHFDRIAAMSHNAFNKLALKIPENLAGRKVLAALIMKTGADDEGIVISVGTGNRCLTGDRLSLEGNSVNDSHAEIITRRGFLRFLYKRLLEYEPVHSDLFEKVSVNKFKIKSNITFHLYISTAPCGDGALFSPRNADVSNMKLENVNSVEHHPTFMSNAQGLLRTKVEGGEGTIPIEAGFVEQTWDGIQRGERLRTMSCSDKICRWNVVGLQGALLSQFLAPIYLDSITLGYLYDHGHLARAVCCRLDRGDPPINELLPEGYRLNHPWLGRVTACDPPRETQKTKSLSINWTIDDDRSEVLDGTEGICYTVIEKNLFSRITKQNMYGDFKCLCRKFNCPQLVASSYNKSKQLSRDFQMAKEVMLKKFHSTDCGTWVAKPVEEEMFA